MTPLECAAAAHNAVSRVGGAFMVDPSVAANAERLGLSFFEFYIAGRAGVLGAVAADDVCAALAILEPGTVTAAWTAAVGRHDPREIALGYADCNHSWGQQKLADAPDLERAAVLAGRLVDGADLADLPLVAGWRALPRPADRPALVAHLLQTLREYRGALHARAVSAAGLTPVEAIVSGPDGAERAGLLGWAGPFPDAAPLAERRAAAEGGTDERAATLFEVLTDDERAEFVRVTGGLLAWIRRPTG